MIIVLFNRPVSRCLLVQQVDLHTLRTSQVLGEIPNMRRIRRGPHFWNNGTHQRQRLAFGPRIIWKWQYSDVRPRSRSASEIQLFPSGKLQLMVEPAPCRRVLLVLLVLLVLISRGKSKEMETDTIWYQAWKNRHLGRARKWKRVETQEMAAVPAFGKGHEVVATIEAFHAKIVLLRAAIELVSLPGSFILTFYQVVKPMKLWNEVKRCCRLCPVALPTIQQPCQICACWIYIEKIRPHRDGWQFAASNNMTLIPTRSMIYKYYL